MDCTSTSALFEGHRAVGERRGLPTSRLAGRTHRGCPLCTGRARARPCRGVRALAGVQRLRGRVFSRAPCETSAPVRCHARGLWGEPSLGVFPFSSRSPRCVFCRGDESPGAPGAGTVLGSLGIFSGVWNTPELPVKTIWALCLVPPAACVTLSGLGARVSHPANISARGAGCARSPSTRHLGERRKVKGAPRLRAVCQDYGCPDGPVTCLFSRMKLSF